MNPKEIIVGPRHRKDLGSLDVLARSIGRHGLLHPPVVTSDRHLVCGLRRLRACESLGWVDVPVRIIDPDDLVEAENDENECRKDFTASERVAIAREIAARLGNRQGQRTDKGDPEPTSGQLAGSSSDPVPEPGAETRDVAARAAGFKSTQEYRRAATVTDKGTKEEVARMDKGDVPVSRAAKEIQRKEKEIRDAAETDPDRFGDLAKRLAEPNAKVDPIHKELKKRQKAGTVKRNVLKDARNVEVPDALRDLFGNPWYQAFADEVAEILTRVAKLKRDVKAQGKLLREWLPVEKCDEFASVASTNLRYLASQVDSNRPHAVCPECGGDGCKGDGTACHKAGWVPKYRLAELKAEGRA